MARNLVDGALHDLLSAFAAALPTPGGGSACAASSAIGVALLMKVASVAGVPHHPLAGIQTQLVDAIDNDATAYQGVVTAYKQPRDSQAERALRTAAVQRALVHATDVPLTIMRLSAEALTEARSIAPRIHRSTAADAKVALLLLRAGFEGARTTVDANLSGLAEADHAMTVRDECRRLMEKVAQDSGEAERFLGVG